jgi:sugar (pentulose or hexulose) kinase
MVEAIRSALDASGVKPEEIAGIGLDGTSCTVVFLDDKGQPLRDAIMWMDIRASKEAEEIAASGDEALEYIGARQPLCRVVSLQGSLDQTERTGGLQ